MAVNGPGVNTEPVNEPAGDPPSYNQVNYEQPDTLSFSTDGLAFGYTNEEGETVNLVTAAQLPVSFEDEQGTTLTATDSTSVFNLIIRELASTLQVIDAEETEWMAAVVENIVLTPAYSDYLEAVYDAADTVVLGEAVVAAFEMLNTDGLVLTEAQTYTTIFDVAEQLTLLGAVDTFLEAVTAVSTAIVLQDVVNQNIQFEAADIIQTAADYATFLEAVKTNAETVQFTDESANAATFSTVIPDTVAFTEAISLAQVLEYSAADTLQIHATILLGDIVYSAWVMNTENTALSRYDDYPFNSFAAFDNKYYGATDTGIYELTGTQDDGSEFAARMKTGLVNFGTAKLKRTDELYIGSEEGGNLYLRAITSDGRKRFVETYKLKASSRRDGNYRVKIGKGLKGVYWQFDLISIDGTFPELDNIQFRPITLSRRV